MKRFQFSKRLLILCLLISMTTLLISRPSMVDAQAGNPNAYGSDAGAPNDAVFVTSEGHVGIGTSAPTFGLTVQGNIQGRGQAYFTQSDPENTLIVDATSTTLHSIYTNDPIDLSLGTNFSRNQLFLLKNGNVGIGTTTPVRQLQILSASSGDIFAFGTSADEGKHSIFGVDTTNRMMYWGLSDAYDYGFRFQNRDGSPHMIIEKNSNVIITGNVGIGTTAPSRKLQILANTGGKTNDIIFFGTSADEGKHSMFGVDTENRMMYWRLQDAYDYGFQFQNRDGSPYMTIEKDNKVTIGGSLTVPILQITGGSDLAEPFVVSGMETIEPGTVVVLDPANPGQLRMADGAYDTLVAGIVSGAGGINPGLIMLQESVTDDDAMHPVALTGKVYVKAVGPIKVGDLLTTSDVPGHAMAATDRDRAFGAILGKAMSPLADETGLVLVLVALQ